MNDNKKKNRIRKPDKYRKFVKDRQLISAAEASADQKNLEDMAERVIYRGSPLHKKSPGDFRLIPACDPRPDKTLCDYDGGIGSIRTAIDLLKCGLKRGFVDKREQPAGWPKFVWAVFRNTAFEAAWTGPGVYHGYPLLDADPFGQDIIKKWNSNER